MIQSKTCENGKKSLETIKLYQIALKAVSSDFGRIQISRTFPTDCSNKKKYFTTFFESE